MKAREATFEYWLEVRARSHPWLPSLHSTRGWATLGQAIMLPQPKAPMVAAREGTTCRGGGQGPGLRPLPRARHPLLALPRARGQ